MNMKIEEEEYVLNITKDDSMSLYPFPKVKYADLWQHQHIFNGKNDDDIILNFFLFSKFS